MEQAELELQLKTWKKLAVSKQILIGAATDALGLSAECSREELKDALDSATQRALEADAKVTSAKKEADANIAAVEARLTQAGRKLAGMQAVLKDADAQRQGLEERLDATRETNILEVKKLTAQLVEKQKALKAINVALADTPENVVKKLKNLRKEKMEEAAVRKGAESDVRSLRKDKQKLEKERDELQATAKDAAKLVEQHRELHTLCETLHEQAASTADEGAELATVTELNEELLKKIVPDTESETDTKSKGKGKGKATSNAKGPRS